MQGLDLFLFATLNNGDYIMDLNVFNEVLEKLKHIEKNKQTVKKNKRT